MCTCSPEDTFPRTFDRAQFRFIYSYRQIQPGKTAVSRYQHHMNGHSIEAWQDESYGFNMSTTLASIREAGAKPCELVKTYNWYPVAVAIDALFPPGVPITVREICIYYPHHVRWQDVMLRVSYNDYRGQDILGIQAVFRGPCQDHMSAPVMNQIQRDAVQRLLPAFRTIGYEGKGDSDMNTQRLNRGAYLDKKMKGFTVPTFEELLRGLNNMPTGPDARRLTQCLTWYLKIRDTFQPRLELNVLHAQALIRALRQSLPPVGSRNLNRYALEQWRKGTASDNIKMQSAEIEGGEEAHDEHRAAKCSGDRAVFNIRKDCRSRIASPHPTSPHPDPSVPRSEWSRR